MRSARRCSLENLFGRRKSYSLTAAAIPDGGASGALAGSSRSLPSAARTDSICCSVRTWSAIRPSTLLLNDEIGEVDGQDPLFADGFVEARLQLILEALLTIGG